MRALVVGHDPVSAKLIDAALRSEGIVNDAAEAGEDALDLAKHYDFDVIVLEMRLPDMEGLDVVRRLRAAGVRTPVLMLSDVSDTEAKVRALAAGAEDYLEKPFHKTELIARIHAVVRRSKGYPEGIIRTGRLTVNLATRSVEIHGRRLHTTASEYSILELLSLRKDTTISKEAFLDHLYGGIDEPELKIIDVFIAKLRKKITKATSGPNYIDTVWGKGYRLIDPSDDKSYIGKKSQVLEPAWPKLEELSNLALEVIDSQLLAIPGFEVILNLEENRVLQRTRIQVYTINIIAKLRADTQIHQDVLDCHINYLNRSALAIQQLLHTKMAQLVHYETVELENTIIHDGNVLRITGSGKEGGVPNTTTWIADTEFRSEAFNSMADFARCLGQSKSTSQKALCNLVFVIELLKAFVSILSQLIPFAGGR